MTAPRDAGGAGFDASWNDGLREALRGVVAQAAGGAAADLDLAGLARELTNPGYRDGWRAINYVESHDEVYRDREPRLARLADPANPRSWYARSRSRVATALLLAAPGIPMLFMGQEILEDKAWADDPAHHPETLIWWDGLSQGDKAMVDQHRLTRELIGLRRQLPALRRGATRVYHLDPVNRVLAMHRWLEGQGQDVVIVASLAEATHGAYRLGLPQPGQWREAMNTDVYDNWINPLAAGNGGSRQAQPHALHGFGWSAELVLPANAVVILARS